MKKLNLIRILLLIIMAFVCTIFTYAQETVTLDDILSEVVDNSFVGKSAKNDKAIAEQVFKFYKSQLKPNLGLSANIPNYSKTSSPIVQPDGSIAFQSIRQASSNISLFATQVLPATGGSIFVYSDLQRFDDFSSDVTQYNGIPVRVGINQSLFGFNPWKFDKQIQAMLIDEAERNYNIRVEESLGSATDQYFNILIATQNLDIAKTNQVVNEKLLKITDERLKLGKVSRDEKLQLEIELNNAMLSVSQATSELGQAIATLYTFVGKAIPPKSTQFDVPLALTASEINIDHLLEAYRSNRPEIIAYHRAKTQARRDLAKAKADYGMQLDLQASIGLARGSDAVKDVYQDPFDEQQFNVSISVPLVDWGKQESAMKQIKLQADNLDLAYEQQTLELENNITQSALLFVRLQSELTLLKDIMDKAQERFSISNDRYVLGNIDITNLTIAQREKDQTQRNYINALKSYWTSYYSLRALSGYDILSNQNIIY